MPKKSYISLVGVLHALLLATWLAACSADNSGDSREVGEPVVFSMALKGDMTRTTTIDNLWSANMQVTISNGTENYNYTTGASPSTTSSVATALTPADDDCFIWPTTNPGWSFAAWCPAGNSRPTSITVAANQSGLSDTDYNAYDLLYCPSTSVTFRQRPINLTFLHLMARIVVIVNSSYTEKKETVKSVQFGDGHIALSRNISESSDLPTTLSNGTTTWSGGTQESTITMRPNTAMTNTSSHVYGFECMIPPQVYSTKIPHLVNISTTGAEQGNRTYYYGNSFNPTFTF